VDLQTPPRKTRRRKILSRASPVRNRTEGPHILSSVKRAEWLTPVEFELISVLWQAGKPLTVGGVLAKVRAGRPVAYTTVMTQLDNLARKGVLTRRLYGKAYLYSPCRGREETCLALVREFVAAYFEGDRDRLRRLLETPAQIPPRTAGEEEEDVSLL
jgi:predicted transcriptional regulator